MYLIPDVERQFITSSFSISDQSVQRIPGVEVVSLWHELGSIVVPFELHSITSELRSGCLMYSTALLSPDDICQYTYGAKYGNPISSKRMLWTRILPSKVKSPEIVALALETGLKLPDSPSNKNILLFSEN